MFKLIGICIFVFLTGCSSGSGGSVAFTIGGSITGVPFSEGLVLQNNAANDLTITAGASNFVFPKSYTSETAYAITIKSQPNFGTCRVENASGIASQNIDNVSVICTLPFQNQALTLTGSVSTPFGTKLAPGTVDGIGNAAKFNGPIGAIIQGSYLYVTDDAGCTLRKIELSTGAVSTVAGLANACDTTDGVGATARFNGPNSMASDGLNLYITEYSGHVVRKYEIATGIVSTVAGVAGTSGSADGMGASARFKNPTGIVTDGKNLYVSDYGNHIIRKIVIATGVVTSAAGAAGVPGATDNPTGTLARFNNPADICLDGVNLYVSDYGNNTIRKIVMATGAVSTIAGSAGLAGATDGFGALARFNQPAAIITDGSNFYISDLNNYRLRKMVIATGEVSTLAGSVYGSLDGAGTAAQFAYPSGLATDGVSIYMADYLTYAIRKIQ